MNEAGAVVCEEPPVTSPSKVKSKIDVVLADSYPILLDGMEHLLTAQADLRVVARCADGEQAMRAVRQHRPDVLVSDFRLPGKNGLLILQDLAKEELQTHVVLLAERIYADEMLEAVRLGAKGILLKEMSGSLLVRCIRKVYAGQTWLETRSAGRAVEQLLHRDAGGREAALVLTPRELEVLRAVSTGVRNRDVAARLNITEGTVKIHLHNIYEKVNVKGRLELILRSIDRGWI
jgi:two-component system nitrate/nitrite response regulator NarL